jgi:hypothetical protein
MPAKLTREDFIKKCKIKWGDRWDYSNVEYRGSKSKISIICNQHGTFLQTASDHLSGCGCPLCDKTKKLGTESFIEKSKKIHGNKWDYSKVKYGKNNYYLVEIICKEHGSFLQRPWAHLRGQGCPNCSNNKLLKNDEFINKCKIIHGDKWDYSLTNYLGRRKIVTIICKEHGPFKQEARIHLDGFGCKMCKSSKLEDYLSNKLKNINEPYEFGKKFENCKNINPLPFDFFLPLRNILLECDGIQHSKPVEYFGGEKRFIYQRNNDEIKTKWAIESGIELFRLRSFNEIDHFIDTIESSKILFDKSIIKDISLDRFESTKNQGDFFNSTDFNYYNRDELTNDIRNFITGLNIEYQSNVKYDDENINWIINNNIYIKLIDNFRDCEIFRPKNWIVNLKEKLEKCGINLILIYPDDWLKRGEIVRSRIKNLIGVNLVKIGSRQCRIVTPDNKTLTKFLNENHIQGYINSSVKIGLEYNGQLISVMTFGKLRKNLGQKSKQDSWELLRFCNKMGFTVIGSATKMLKNFLKNYNPKYILSYADRCWSSLNKNVYIEMGMSLVSKTQPSYSYLVGDKKWDRWRYRKDKLVEFGYINEKWTERSICSSNFIFKIFDAGCLKYEIYT